MWGSSIYIFKKTIRRNFKTSKVSVAEFVKCCDRCNKNLFLKDNEGNLLKDEFGSLTKIIMIILNESRYYKLWHW